MTTSIGNARVYQFLARTERVNGEDWQKQADTNGDGYVNYKEFEAFINANYTSIMDGEVLSRNDMNIFWSCVDIDRSTKANGVSGLNNLDAKELEKLNDDMQDYVDLETAIGLAIKNVPNQFGDPANSTAWKAEVSKLITAEFQVWQQNKQNYKNFSDYLKDNENLERIMLQATANVQTDIEIANLMNTPGNHWAVLEEYGYKIGEDKEIDAKIEQLVKDYVEDNDLTYDNISKDYDEIIKKVLPQIEEYLKSKGLGKLGEVIATPEQDIDKELPITKEQLAGFSAKIYEAYYNVVKNLPNYNEYKEIYDKWVDSKVNAALTSVDKQTYSAYNNLVDGLKAEYISNEIETDEQLQAELNEAESWKALKTNLGNIIDTNLPGLFNSDQYVSSIAKTRGLYVQVKDDILSNIQSYTTDSNDNAQNLWDNKIKNVAQGKVLQLVAKESSNGFGLPSAGDDATYLKTLLNTYNSIQGNINYNKNLDLEEDEKLRATAELAVGFFKDVVKLGYRDIVTKIAGYDYDKVDALICHYDVNGINTLVNNVNTEVKAKINAEKYANYTTDNWSVSGNEGPFVNEIEYKMTATTTVKNGSTPINQGITYEIEDSAGIAKIDSTGNITFTANKPGQYSFTVHACVDDTRVGKPHTIDIEVKDKNDKSTQALTTDDFNDYGDDGHLKPSRTDGLNPEQARNDANTEIKSFIDNIVTGFGGKGYNANALKTAGDRVKEYFEIALSMMSPDGVAEKKETYKTETKYTSWGEEVQEEWFYRSRIPEGTIGKYRSNEAGIQWYRCTCWGNRSDQIIISKDLLLDKFIEYYNQLIS